MNEKKKDEKKTPDAAAVQNAAPAFTKAQLISSKKYKNRKDALTVLLSDDRLYTFEETDKLLNEFMKGKVN